MVGLKIDAEACAALPDGKMSLASLFVRMVKQLMAPWVVNYFNLHPGLQVFLYESIRTDTLWTLRRMRGYT